jgi:hypothetical protein
MKSKLIRVLLSVGFLTIIYYLPSHSRESVKQALEVMVVANLGIEVLHKMRQG